MRECESENWTTIAVVSFFFLISCGAEEYSEKEVKLINDSVLQS